MTNTTAPQSMTPPIIQGVVLVSPKHHANIGGIARSMKAFGCETLIIVQPLQHVDMFKAAHVSEQGKDIIANVQYARSIDEIKGKKVATISAKDNERYGFPLSFLSESISELEASSSQLQEPLYLVMGREGSGLTEDELRQCDIHATLPTNGKYGILNLCQATTIALYEFQKSSMIAPTRALLTETRARANESD